METSLAITRKSASNLALAFVLLPKPKRDAMCVLYAFCREVDDVADEDSVPVEVRRDRLAVWRKDLILAIQGQIPQSPILRELQPVIQTFGLDWTLLDEIIKGCEMDLETLRYSDFEHLDLYCYRVASAVGLLSIRIFGHNQPATRDYAIHLGKALQLTNILRDVKNDAQRGRIYLPQSELKRFGVTDQEILDGCYSARYQALAQCVGVRARHFYNLARQVLPAEDRRNMVAAELMGSVYWQLLLKLEKASFNVFGPHPLKIGKVGKLALILQAWLRHMVGARESYYGAASNSV